MKCVSLSPAGEPSTSAATCGAQKTDLMYYSITEERENIINQLMEQQVREFFIQMDDGTSGEPRIATAPYVEYPPYNPEAVEALREVVYERYTRPATEVRAEIATRKEKLLNPTEPIDPQDEEFYVDF